MLHNALSSFFRTWFVGAVLPGAVLLSAVLFTQSVVFAQDADNQGLTLNVSIEFEDTGLKVHEGRLRTLLSEAFSEYVSLFGGMPRKRDGSAYTDLKLEVVHGLGGEAEPEFIQLRINDTKLFGFYSWEMVLLHEVFHLWSAETFSYQSEREQWFNEGVAEYYTFKLAAKLGIIPAEQVATRFTFPIAAYLSGAGIGAVSMSQAGLVNEGKRKHYFLIYHGGFTAAMALDYQIRAQSNNVFSLDYLMRELYLEKSTQNRYTNATLIELLDQSTGFNAKPFFKKFIEGREVIPIGQYFDLGMLDIWLRTGQNISLDIKSRRILESMLGMGQQ